MPTSREEFSKIQLESQTESTDSDISDNLSDLESAVTDKEEDPDEEYAVDAIKYAYWLKRKGTPAQWYYGILWGGYLKTESEMDIPSSGMNEEDNLKDDQVYQFWTSFNPLEVPTARLKPGHREPLEPQSKALKYPHRFDCPTQRMKEWLRETEPKRHLSTFIARRQYINNNSDRPHLYPVPKKYSDYYVHKREVKKQQKAQRQAVQNVAGPSTTPAISNKDIPSTSSKLPSPRRSASKEKDKSGLDMINEIADPPSDDLSDLSDLDTVSDDDEESRKQKAAKKSTSNAEQKKRKKQSPPVMQGDKPKRSKVQAPNSSKPLPDPLPPPSRLGNMEKIKKKSNEEPLFYAPSPASTIFDGPTPHFGEPASGIFDPESPDQSLQVPILNVIASTPKPSIDEKAAESKAVKSPTRAPQSKSPATDEAAKPELSLLARTKVLLEQQKRGTEAKKAAAPGDPVSIAKPSSPVPTPKSPSPSSTTLGAATSAVRNVSGSPELEAPSGPSGSATLASPSDQKPDLANRPRYQQPVRMKFIDNVAEPLGRPHLSPSLKGTPDFSGQSSVSGRSPGNVQSPMESTQRSPLNSGGKTPPYSASSSTPAASAGAANVNKAPTLPRNFVPRQVPTDPSRASLRPPGLREQPNAFKASKPPPEGPKHSPAGTSRHGLPTRPPPFQLGPPAVFDTRPRPGNIPVDPRQASAGPQYAALVYNAVADPRRRGTGPLRSPVSLGGRSPLDPGIMASPRSPGSETRKLSSGAVQAVETVCEFRADVQLGHVDIQYRLGLFKGSTLPGAEHLQITRFFLASPNSTLIRVSMEEVDDICLTGILGLGSQIIEWTRVSLVLEPPPSSSAGRGEYENLKDRVTKLRKAFVAYTEYMPEHGVSCHYAIIIASPDAVDFRQVGMGSWSKESIKVGLFVVALPLTSVAVPCLPNPVRPSADLLPSPIPPSFTGAVPTLQSYGLDHAFLTSLTGTRVMKYPGEDGPTDFLHGMLTSSLKQYNAIPATDVDTLLVINHRFSRTLKSSSIKANLIRRTTFYAYGPSLQLYPSQWGLTKIWQQGGLVTFSPTFILRNPDAFSEIMKMIRSADMWAAYILPSVIEWFNESKDRPLRCPDPAKAFEALARSLLLNHHVLEISGPEAQLGGGMAISCVPPVIHNAEGCRKWMDWLRRVTDETEFDKLVNHCKGVSSRTFSSSTGEGKKGDDLDLVEIERAQMEDLTAMRARPHLVPYRRYIYIGGTALGEEIKAGMKEIEFVAAENIPAVLSAVSLTTQVTSIPLNTSAPLPLLLSGLPSSSFLQSPATPSSPRPLPTITINITTIIMAHALIAFTMMSTNLPPSLENQIQNSQTLSIFPLSPTCIYVVLLPSPVTSYCALQLRPCPNPYFVIVLCSWLISGTLKGITLLVT